MSPDRKWDEMAPEEREDAFIDMFTRGFQKAMQSDQEELDRMPRIYAPSEGVDMSCSLNDDHFDLDSPDSAD